MILAVVILVAVAGYWWFNSSAKPVATSTPTPAVADCSKPKPAPKPVDVRKLQARVSKLEELLKKEAKVTATPCCLPQAAAAAPAPAPPAPAPALTPTAYERRFEVVFSATNWSEAIRPAFQDGRVNGAVIGRAMNAKDVTPYAEPTGLKLVLGDGKVIPMRTAVRNRGGLMVNEAIYPMSREEAANFSIKNVVLESGNFIAPRDAFIQAEIKNSAARGSQRIVFFLVAAPDGVVPPPPK